MPINLGAFGYSTNPQTDVSVDETKTLAELAAEKNINTNGNIVTVDGRQINASDLNKSLKDLGVSNDSLIFVVLKRDGARN